MMTKEEKTLVIDQLLQGVKTLLAKENDSRLDEYLQDAEMALEAAKDWLGTPLSFGK